MKSSTPIAVVIAAALACGTGALAFPAAASPGRGTNVMD